MSQQIWRATRCRDDDAICLYADFSAAQIYYSLYGRSTMMDSERFAAYCAENSISRHAATIYWGDERVNKKARRGQSAILLSLPY